MKTHQHFRPFESVSKRSSGCSKKRAFCIELVDPVDFKNNHQNKTLMHEPLTTVQHTVQIYTFDIYGTYFLSYEFKISYY